jgi:dTMP kinase
MTARGFFISLEGPDGCGKTTQAELLRDSMEKAGRRCWLTREPGGTDLGESIRDLLLSFTHTTMSPRAEMLLYAASRAQHVDEHIRPKLHQGITVISDRFIDSSLIYQGLGLGLSIEDVWQVNLIATGGLLPDLTVVLELDPWESAKRLEEKLRQTKGHRDRIESRDEGFHQVVSSGYSRLGQMFPDRVLALDARTPVRETTQLILNHINKREGGQ